MFLIQRSVAIGLLGVSTLACTGVVGSEICQRTIVDRTWVRSLKGVDGVTAMLNALPTQKQNGKPSKKAAAATVQVESLTAQSYYDRGNDSSGRVRILIRMDNPSAYSISASAGRSSSSLRSLRFRNDTSTYGPYPILGTYFQLGSRSRVLDAKVVRIRLNKGSKPVNIGLPDGRTVSYWDFKMDIQEDPGGLLGTSTDETSY